MTFPDFFKTQWNLVVGVAVSILVILSGVVIEPTISMSYIEGGIEPDKVCRFVVAAFLLLLLIPFSIFKQKKHMWKWWLSAIIMLVFATILYFSYNKFCNDNMVFVKSTNERLVIGRNLYPMAKKVKDSLELVKRKSISNAYLLNTMADDAQDLWPEKEIRAASVTIIKYYLLLILSLSLFLMLAMQALFCLTETPAIENP